MQLILPFSQTDDQQLSNFCVGKNEALLNSLCQSLQNFQQPFFYLWSGESVGKSHLLKAYCNAVTEEGLGAIYIPMQKTKTLSPMVLENLEQNAVVCIDDLQSIAGNFEWEVAIFDLFNRIKACGKSRLIFSANKSPYGLDISLPDLKSRLTWGEIYQVHDLSEAEKCQVLQRNAYQMGIELSAETAKFLIQRLSRDLNSLNQALIKLNQASLQSQRNLTIPFVKEVLGL